MSTIQSNSHKPTIGRFKKIFFSLGASLLLKIITFVSAFVLTRLIIVNYGSEVNGMISSITQFLGFITLLEGGIGGVARATLFKPLAEKNEEEIRKIISYVEKFFRIIAFVFIFYSIAIALIFPLFDHSNDYFFTFSLVLVVAITSFCEYFFGISYSILLVSDQKAYIANIITLVATLLNFIVCVILILFELPIHIVKIFSVSILLLKPIFLSIYCKKKYNLKRVKLSRDENLMPQKWSGLGVHLAYCLHRNTDTLLITIFLSLSAVSIYSVYNMVISGILTLAGALASGFEATLGNMYSNGEIDNLKNKFKKYVFYYQLLCTILLSATIVLILPFIKIYTFGVTDIDYYQPFFAFTFVIAEFLYCLRVPFNDLMIATNCFKDIKWGAYIEAFINIIVSLILVIYLGLIGVAIGTACAMLFRLIHFLWFFNKKKIQIGVWWFIKNSLVSIGTLLLTCLFIPCINMSSGNSFISWTGYAFVVTLFVIIFALILNAIFLKKDLMNTAKYVFRRFKK